MQTDSSQFNIKYFLIILILIIANLQGFLWFMSAMHSPMGLCPFLTMLGNACPPSNNALALAEHLSAPHLLTQAVLNININIFISIIILVSLVFIFKIPENLPDKHSYPQTFFLKKFRGKKESVFDFIKKYLYRFLLYSEPDNFSYQRART